MQKARFAGIFVFTHWSLLQSTVCLLLFSVCCVSGLLNMSLWWPPSISERPVKHGLLDFALAFQRDLFLLWSSHLYMGEKWKAAATAHKQQAFGSSNTFAVGTNSTTFPTNLSRMANRNLNTSSESATQTSSKTRNLKTLYYICLYIDIHKLQWVLFCFQVRTWNLKHLSSDTVCIIGSQCASWYRNPSDLATTVHKHPDSRLWIFSTVVIRFPHTALI